VQIEGETYRRQVTAESIFTDEQPDNWTPKEFKERMVKDYKGKPLSIYYKEPPLPVHLKLVKEEPYRILNLGLGHLPHNITIRTVFQPYPTLNEWVGVLDRVLKLIEEGYEFVTNEESYCSFISPSVGFGYGKQDIKTLLIL
jgi:hypothetical protein